MQIKKRLLLLKQQALTVWFIARDPDVPRVVQLIALATAAYAFSPIDLIPDFIPVLGLLDDLVLIPLGVMLVLKLTPAPIHARASELARSQDKRPRSHAMAWVVVSVWLLLLILSFLAIRPVFMSG